jgi:hypothetical protein
MIKHAIGLLLVALPAWAQQPAPRAAAPANCTDVQVGSAQSYDCINAQLGAVAVGAPRPSSMDAPVSATSPSNVVGTYNEAGTKETLAAQRAARQANTAPPQPILPRPR